ncbi:MAG: hypothetical protein GY696_07725 [Gammaproteobacteria bacterium]|nr:hypothetical protein [Gammaproteobacteria bacterium]
MGFVEFVRDAAMTGGSLVEGFDATGDEYGENVDSHESDTSHSRHEEFRGPFDDSYQANSSQRHTDRSRDDVSAPPAIT